MGSEYLDKLEKLTPKLPDMVSYYNGYVEYNISGTCLGYPLYNDPRAAAQWSYISGGSLFGTHHHEAKEWLIIFEGEVEVCIGDVSKIISVGESIIIEPNEPHSVRALKDTRLFGITIPREAGYPDDKR